MKLPSLLRWMICVLLLGATCGPLHGQTRKMLYPELWPAPDVSKAKQQEFAAKKAAYEALMKRVEADKIPFESLSPQEKALLDAEMEVMREGVHDLVEFSDNWYNAGGPYRITASSTLSSDKDAYVPDQAHDFKLNTAWVEGKSDQGIGESLVYHFRPFSPPVTEVLIYNGYGKSEYLYQANGRPRVLRLYVNGEAFADLNLSDTRGRQRFQLGDTLQSTQEGQDLLLRFEIMSIYPGNKYQDVCISEIQFDGIGVLCVAAGTGVRLATGDEVAVETLQVGDAVMSYDPTTGQMMAASIEGIAKRTHDHLATLTFQDGSRLSLTVDHPLLAPTGQWIAVAPDLARMYASSVASLKVGDWIQGDQGPMQVQKIEIDPAFRITYTITRLHRGSCWLAGGVWIMVEDLEEAPSVHQAD